jgi:hypothetical protein
MVVLIIYFVTINVNTFSYIFGQILKGLILIIYDMHLTFR